mgnify:CR=1 FL=1
MCSPQNAQLVSEALDGFIANRDQFTAFDVTQAARRNGADEPHGILKGEVHAAWQNLRDNEDYDRQVINMGMNPNPWLYFPQGTDPQDYLDAHNATTPTTDDTDDEDDDEIDGVKVTKSENRLHVSRVLLFKIGVKAGDDVELDVSSGEITVFKPNNGVISQNPKTMHVDAQGSLRINPTTLNEAHLSVATPFTITTDSNKITVTQ